MQICLLFCCIYIWCFLQWSTMWLRWSNTKSSNRRNCSSLTLNMKFVAILTLVALQAILVHGNVGTAISYGPPYTRESNQNCNMYSHSVQRIIFFICEYSYTMWCLLQYRKGSGITGAACGRKYRLTCLSRTNRPCKQGTIDVQVVDLCPQNPCPASLLLSKNASSAISSSSNARVNIEYIQ